MLSLIDGDSLALIEAEGDCELLMLGEALWLIDSLIEAEILSLMLLLALADIELEIEALMDEEIEELGLTLELMLDICPNTIAH
jgi:hypothetical protein